MCVVRTGIARGEYDNCQMSQLTTTPPTATSHDTWVDELSDVPLERRPRHIAIIMDGNGRWAVERNMPRIAGHRAGARSVRDIVMECGRLGVKALTLYSFSLENWKRPASEVDALMDLYLEYLVKERRDLVENNVRFLQLGRREGLPASVLSEVDQTVAATRHCTGLTLALALNYSSRAEITDAFRSIATKVKQGGLDPSAITEATISDHLYTAGLPDPDLLIRTAGELRVSNYLLWQISYAEIHVSDLYWPDFRVPDLHAAIRDYASRSRRFGAVDQTNS
jgi:undecaprenyl diphosphate synthase